MTDTQSNQPSPHWQFPKAAEVGRIIPKEKIYQNANAKADLKQLFVEQVSQVKWAYKLAENTTNLSKTEQVHELEVIHVKLKTQSLDSKILTAIDKAIPHPTLFVLSRQTADSHGISNTQLAYQAAHKLRHSTKANKEKWQQSAYLKGQWITENSQTAVPLPAAINLEQLYHQLLEALLPLSLRTRSSEQGEYYAAQASSAHGVQGALQTNNPPQIERSLEQKIDAFAAIESLNKQLKKVEIKRDKEKQFNRRCELNEQFKAIKKQIAELTAQ